jgi:hypothetical protein
VKFSRSHVGVSTLIVVVAALTSAEFAGAQEAATGKGAIFLRRDLRRAAGQPIGQERMLTELVQRLRDVRQAPTASSLRCGRNAGAMLRIEPAR